MDNTKIEWADATWSPIMGCTPVSSGCKNCYARRMMCRYKSRKGWPESPGMVTLFPERLQQPFNWKKPRRIFVCSMGDLFHDDVSFEYIAAVFGAMAANPQHTFLVLTKRWQKMARFFRISASFKWTAAVEWADSLLSHETQIHPDGSGPIHCKWGPNPSAPWPLPNVHLGVSVENQETADERIPALLRTPAAKRFVSYEPALGPVDMQYAAFNGADSLTSMEGINQIICGAETGPGARTMDLDWARSVRDQCAAADVPFFFKRDSDGNRELDGIMHEGMIK